jgi:hypothetical protein
MVLRWLKNQELTAMDENGDMHAYSLRILKICLVHRGDYGGGTSCVRRLIIIIMGLQPFVGP